MFEGRMILDDMWKVVGVGENVTMLRKHLVVASYCCRLCKAPPVLTKHTVANFSPTVTKQR